MKRLLQVCFIAAMVFGLASCSKDDTKPTGNGTGTGTGEIPTSLVGTTWSWSTDGGGSLQFVSDSMAVVTVNNYHNHGDSIDRSVPKGGVFYGTYTYSNGNGTLWLYIDGSMLEVHFTVSGNTLTATGTPDGDVVMTLVGGNPQPGPNPGGDINSLVGTQWAASDGEAQITLTFVSATETEVIVVPPSGVTERYHGTYTYSNGSGTLIMTADSTTYNITFTVSGNTLVAHNTPGGDVTFTLVSNPQPGPNPGGDLRNSLVGTGWMYMNDEVIVAVEFGPNAMVGVVVSPVNGGDDMEYYGSYTYNNFNGTISINVDGQDYTIHFVVNGETMVASDTPVGNITLTLMNQ